MLNLAYILDDANHAMARYSDHLVIVPLPAAVYMMQVDVINHYCYALDHYFPLTLNEPYLQNSSLGTPYQKWSYFTNSDFQMLSFAIHNLLRYTSRLVHETELSALEKERHFAGVKSKSNSYTDPICEVRHHNKAIGITVHEDHHLSIVALRTKPNTEKVISRSTERGQTLHFLVTQDEEGREHEQPIGKEQAEQLTEVIKTERIAISDRSTLATLRERGKSEIAGLVEKNRVFGEACNAFYRTRNVAEPFSRLNESYWI